MIKLLKAALCRRLCYFWIMAAALIAAPAHAQTPKPQDTAAIMAGKVYLSRNAKRAEVTTLPSGLQYEIIQAGDGPQPTTNDDVLVHYRGRLTDGREFDSSFSRGRPSKFAVTGLIPGWTEALLRMREGAHWVLTIPAELAYGETGTEDIPPHAVLVFEVELLGVIPPPPPHPKVADILANPIPQADCGAPPKDHASGNRWQDCMARYIKNTLLRFEAEIAILQRIHPSEVPNSQKQAVNDYFAEARAKLAEAEARLAAFPGIPQ